MPTKFTFGREEYTFTGELHCFVNGTTDHVDGIYAEKTLYVAAVARQVLRRRHRAVHRTDMKGRIALVWSKPAPEP